jgi:hypothetical protein
VPYDDQDDDLDISIGRMREHRAGSDIPNYLTQSILVTLCCCLPFGIVAIVNAAKVNPLIAAGDYAQAQEASDAAKKWCMVSFVLGVIGSGFYCLVQLMEMNRGNNIRF